jgi:hypothetical protein
MECLSHPDRGRKEQRVGVAIFRSIAFRPLRIDA